MTRALQQAEAGGDPLSAFLAIEVRRLRAEIEAANKGAEQNMALAGMLMDRLKKSEETVNLSMK